MGEESMNAQREWLEKNHDQVEWRLAGPNFRNRFDSSVSEEKLEEYVRDPELLWEHCASHCFLDDACIIKVTDMMFFEYESSHPNLIGLEQEDLRNYLEAKGVWARMREELDKQVDLCRRELEARRNGTESPL